MSITHIEIKFTGYTGTINCLYDGKSPYRSVVNSSDDIKIYSDRIEIKAKRSSFKSNPFQHHNSTIYKQIVKSLCLYYLLQKESCQIAGIQVIRNKIPKETPQIRQVLTSNSCLEELKSIKESTALILLEETPTGRSVLNAITHLIKSLDSSLSAFDCFEKLWRAFNALYKDFAKKDTEIDCHKFLREYIANKNENFPLSLEKVTNLNYTEIRKNIRLNEMILNNHATQKKTKAFADSIMRNSDSRVLQMYKESLPIRKNFW